MTKTESEALSIQPNQTPKQGDQEKQALKINPTETPVIEKSQTQQVKNSGGESTKKERDRKAYMRNNTNIDASETKQSELMKLARQKKDAQPHTEELIPNNCDPILLTPTTGEQMQVGNPTP